MSRVRKVTGWRLFLRTMAGRAYPRIVGTHRHWSGPFFEIGLPLIALAAYVFLCRAIGAAGEFAGYVLLGGAMSAFWANVLWAMANQFFWEKETGNLALYIMAPTSMMAILLGMAVGGIVVASLRAGAIVVIGSWLFGVEYDVASVPMLAAVFGLTLAALYGLGMTCASLFLLFGRGAWHLVSLSQEPVHLVSGMYFPVRSLGPWIAGAASLLPLTLGLDAIRQLAFSTSAATAWLSVRTEAMILGLLAAIYLVAARGALAYMERLAIAEGRLTESGA